MKMHVLIAACGVATLAGCATGSRYAEPKPALPAAYSVALPDSKQAAAATPQELAQWWRQFNDPQLTKIVEGALDANRDVQLAIARIREARAMRSIADARALPQLGLSGSAARDRISQNGRLPTTGITNPANIYQGGFDASWELDAFGSVSHARDAAAAEFERSEFDRAAVAVSVSAEVVTSYLRLRAAQAQLAVLDDQLAIAKESIAIAAARVKSGLVSDFDLLRARELAETLAARRPQLLADADVATRRLGVLSGAQASSLIAELSAQRPLPAVMPQLPPTLPAQLLARRPDLRAIERTLAAENARVGIADAGRYPSLSANLTLGLLSLATGNFANAASAVWNAGARFSAPLYSGGSRNAELDAARARYDQAAIRYDDATARAVEEVEAAALRYAGARERREKLVAALNYDEDARNLAAMRYQSGLANFLEVLDAQRQLFSVQADEVATREETLNHLVALYKALGGGWDATAARQASAQR
jgi:NodT family efflux transporter outer membrane factor (OMF) lipoprotein